MIPLRLARELTYQLDHAVEHERLAKALACVPVFLVMWNENISAVLILWQQLATSGHKPEDYYTLTRMQGCTDLLYVEMFLALSGLFEKRGRYDRSLECSRQALNGLRRMNATEDRADTEMNTRELHLLAQSYLSIGWTLLQRGDFPSAATHLKHALDIAERIGDVQRMCMAMAHLGTVHMNQGQFMDAMLSFERSKELAEQIGNLRAAAYAIGNMGNIHNIHDRFEEAIACYERAIEVSERIGDAVSATVIIGNAGNVYLKQGQYAEALVYYKRQIEIATRMGEMRSMENAVNNMGNVYKDQGRYAEAIACHERSLEIATRIGDASGIAISTGNLGFEYALQGRYSDAIASMHEALKSHRAIGFQFAVAAWLGGIAQVLLESGGALPEARANAEEAMQISSQLGVPGPNFAGRMLLARIDAAEGKIALATEKLEAMLAEATEEEQIAELHYWLWKINSVPAHPESILAMYEKLNARIPKFEFVKRIAELKGERVPKSADDLDEPSTTLNY